MKCRISKNEQEYQPLYYGRTSLILDSSNLEFDEEALEYTIETEDPSLSEKFRKTHRGQKVASRFGKGIIKEFFRANSIVRKWMYDKQVYLLSEEMEEALLKQEYPETAVETLTNAWEFLPTKSFCLNFGENSKIAKEIKADCIYVYVYKKEKIWICSVVRFSKHITAEGADFFFGLPADMDEFAENTLKDEKNKYDDEIDEICNRTRTIVYAVLNYLSNDLAIIEETKESKRNYQEPDENAPLKNDMSEIREFILSPGKTPEDFMLKPENEDSLISEVGKWASEFQDAGALSYKVKITS